MRKRDYYEVLEVSRGAAASDIRRAYRRLARRYSPDVNLWDDRRGGLFDEIAEAYRALGDPTARALYDRLGHEAFQRPGEATSDRELRGEDLHYPIEMEFEHALRGVQAVIEVARSEPCEACDAAGGIDGRRAERCGVCKGRPVRIAVGNRELPVAARCEACRGTGWQVPEPCPACGGRGTVSQQRRIPVAIPPGVDTGVHIRVPGEGHASPAPGARGDLVMITRVRPHSFFTRKGDNIWCEVPISVPEAALGARIQIPTPDGPSVVTIPAGTQNGQVLRIRGRGCPRLGRDGRGDLLVAMRVMIPRNADTTLEEVLRTLQRLLPEDPRAEIWARREAQP